MQVWKYPEGNIPAREWPIGWTAIDGDEWIEHEGEPVDEEVHSQISSPKRRVSIVCISDRPPQIHRTLPFLQCWSYERHYMILV